jgi:hypothetical protein
MPIITKGNQETIRPMKTDAGTPEVYFRLNVKSLPDLGKLFLLKKFLKP